MYLNFHFCIHKICAFCLIYSYSRPNCNQSNTSPFSTISVCSLPTKLLQKDMQVFKSYALLQNAMLSRSGNRTTSKNKNRKIRVFPTKQVSVSIRWVIFLKLKSTAPIIILRFIAIIISVNTHASGTVNHVVGIKNKPYISLF